MFKSTILLLAALAGAAQARPAATPDRATAAPQRQMARIAAQQTVLAEEMGRLQLDMLVSEILAPPRTRAGRAQLTLASARR